MCLFLQEPGLLVFFVFCQFSASASNVTIKFSLSTPGICPSDSVIDVTPHHLAFGRPGQLYGTRLYTRFTAGVPNGGYESWSPEKLVVRVRDGGGLPVSNCRVLFETGPGASNGWVFPARGKNTSTDDNGVLEAHWIAGSDQNQHIFAVIQMEDGATSRAEVTGTAGGERTLAQALYHSFNPSEKWFSWKMDVKLVKFPDASYFSIINKAPMYTGLVGGGSRGVLFTTWWKTLGEQHIKTDILDPVMPEDGSNYQNATHKCQQVQNGAEGYHASCEYIGVTGFQEGSTYRFEMLLDHHPNYDNIEYTDVSIWFTDVTNGFPKVKVATMRYHGAEFQSKSIGGFLENPYDDKFTCLDTALQYVVFSNIEYKTFNNPEEWSPINHLKPSHGKGCANVWYESKEDGFHLSTGDTQIGYPLQVEKDIVLYKDSPPLTSCNDNIKDGFEYNTDCGGSCEKCQGSPDEAQESSCFDGIKNGDEEYVDCGGRCEVSCEEAGGNLNYNRITAHTWSEALEKCAALDKILAIITTPTQNKVAKDVCESVCWIGITRNVDCKTPSCWSWRGANLELDQTVFNHYGYPGEPIYTENKPLVYISQSGLGRWRTTTTTDSHVEFGLCSDLPETFPPSPQPATQWTITSRNDDAWSVISTQLFLDYECRTPVVLTDVGRVDSSSVLNTVVSHMEYCSEFYQTCVCHGFVRMGVGERWSRLVRVEVSINCNFYEEPAFGGDPAPGESKQCFCTRLEDVYSDEQIKAVFVRPSPVGCAVLRDVDNQIIPEDEYDIQPVSGCIVGWSSYEGHCYRHVSEPPLDWISARQNCLQLEQGADLVSIGSEGERDFVRGLYEGKGWLGGNDLEEEGTWRWSDGTPFTFDNWGGSEPDNYYGDDCMCDHWAIHNAWGDDVCANQKSYTCKK